MKLLVSSLTLAALVVPVFAVDTDADGASDSYEIATGFDPADAASTPPVFRAIGINFVRNEPSLDSMTWGEETANGYLPQDHWNHARLTNTSKTEAEIVLPTPGQVVDASGAATSVKFTADSGRPWNLQRLNQGLSDQLFNGNLRVAAGESMDVDVTDVPYSNYDVYLYYGAATPFVITEVTLNKGSENEDKRAIRPRVTYSGPYPFRPERETLGLTEDLANIVTYRGLQSSSFSIHTQTVAADSHLAAIQIIDRSQDSDADQIPDWWELLHRTDASTNNPSADLDDDGVSNFKEFQLGSDPRNPDTDGDGLSDLIETNTGTFVSLEDTGTNPASADSDGDGLNDFEELYHFNSSDPSLKDTDGDLVEDSVERAAKVSAKDSSISALPLPQISTATEFRWETQNIQLRADRFLNWRDVATGDDTRDIAMLDIQNINVDSFNVNFLSRSLSWGLVEKEGKLVHALNGTTNGSYFDPARNRLGIIGTVDLRAACGFSNRGQMDFSDRLTFLVTGERVAGTDDWTLNFIIKNETTDEEVSRETLTGMRAHASINAGTANWRNKHDRQKYALVRPGREIEVLVGGDSVFDSLAFAELADVNNDGIPDQWASDNGITSAEADKDGDSLSNYAEYLAGTNPSLADSDADGVNDDVELASFSDATDPLSKPYFATRTAATGGDFDNNGLSDVWEGRFSRGRNLLASADPDGDGHTNREESIAGTDPFDPKSFFELAITPLEDSVRLSWQGNPRKQFHLFASGDLNFETAMSGPVTSGMELPISDLKEFYRASVSDLDTDSDGVTDAEEFALGSDPFMVNSTRGEVALDLNGDGTPDRQFTGDYATFIETYSNRSDLSEGTLADLSLSPQEAARFLTQSTFGPISSDIEELRKIGITAWLDDQVAQTPTSHEAIMESYLEDLATTQKLNGLDYQQPVPTKGFVLYSSQLTNAFVNAAVKGEDQLRQRMAFALSQLLVVSRRETQLNFVVNPMANYYDMLADHAFGNYYDLLKAVTRHPVMGIYLSSVANLPPDPSINRYPDENYAREVMQLFTIGIHKLNNDGSFELDDEGRRVETYDQLDVIGMARVMTGLGRDFGTLIHKNGSMNHPMRMFAQYHDFGEKEILNGIVLPAREASNANAEQELDEALLALFNHQNTPPFISRALIQFFTTDNPSPQYIERVANVFIDDGEGVRGNLEAVIRAILLDPEARDVGIAKSRPEYGRLREPYIRLMHLARVLRMDKHPELTLWEINEEITDPLGMTPLKANSVFNFYKPDHKPAGPLLDKNLIGGPFEILDTQTSVATPNYFWEVITEGFQRRRERHGDIFGYDLPPFYDEFIPYAADSERLLDHINLVLCAGRMKANSRAAILDTLNHPRFSNGKNLSEKIALALYGAVIIPESAVLK